MPCSVSRILTLALSLAAVCSTGMAQQSGITAKLHPWGRFDPGAWKLVRVVTETLDEHGRVVSTNSADTTTALVDIDNDGVTLEIRTCMEVAGKRFQAEPQTVKQGFHGELFGPNLQFKEPVAGEVMIENQKHACKVQQLEIVGPTERTAVRLFYSAARWPYVLRRECVASDSEGKSVLSETTVEVTALDMPVRIQEETHSGAYVKTVSKNAKGTVTGLAVVLPDVPGGVVSHSQKEVDKSGRVVRRSTLELVDYGVNADKDRPSLFNSRKHPGRRSKGSSR
jgi:hypothetical protein